MRTESFAAYAYILVRYDYDVGLLKLLKYIEDYVRLADKIKEIGHIDASIE